MARKAKTVDDLTDAINDILEEYKDDVEDCVKNVAVQYGKICKKKLEAASPKDTGKYAKGWAYSKKTKNKKIGVTIYNRAKPTLTHLLESGHAKVNGGRVEGKPHIAPVTEEVCNDFAKTVEQHIKSGDFKVKDE